MEKRDRYIIGMLTVAVLGWLTFEWWFAKTTNLVTAVTGAEPEPVSAIGPASAWANVPQRFILPPSLAGWMPTQLQSTPAPGSAQANMFTCGGCGQ